MVTDSFNNKFGYMYYKWNKGENARLSPNFTTKELQCHCTRPECKQQKISTDLVAKLQVLREQMDRPLTITAGYRCEAHNAEVGGVKSSQHLLGNAADVSAKDLDKLKELGEGLFMAVGDGRNKGFIHMDTRVDKRRSWTY